MEVTEAFDRGYALGPKTGAIASTRGLSDAAKAPSPFHRMAGSVSHLREFVLNLEAISEKLCGAEPANNINGAPAAGYAGLFGAIDEASDEISALTYRATEALRRIENKLP